MQTCAMARLAAAATLGWCGLASAEAQDVRPANCFDAINYVDIFADRPWSDRFEEAPWDNFQVAAHYCIMEQGQVVHVVYRQHDFAVVLNPRAAKLYIRIVDDQDPLVALLFGSDATDAAGNYFTNYVFDLQTSELLGSGASPDLIEVDEIRALAGREP